MSYDPIAADLLRENRAIKADLARVRKERVRDVSECVSLTNRLAQAEKDLADCREVLGLIDVKLEPMDRPFDRIIREICEMFGYGAVMDSAATQWRKKDPIGALTVGPTVAMVRSALDGVGVAQKGVGPDAQSNH